MLAKVNIFACPSDANADNDWGDFTPISYHYCVGDWLDEANQTDYKNPRGAFSLCTNEYRGINSLLDGTSNTIVFSESIALQGNSSGKMVKGNLVYSEEAIGDPTAFDLKTFYNYNKGGREYTSGSIDSVKVGRRWLDSGTISVTFATVFPPNSGPNAAGLADENSRGLVSASSNHKGGVQCGLGDGSVRFVSDTINCQTSGVGSDYSGIKVKTNGESQFGVWGALGSINGGEAKQL